MPCSGEGYGPSPQDIAYLDSIDTMIKLLCSILREKESKGEILSEEESKWLEEHKEIDKKKVGHSKVGHPKMGF